MKIYKQHDGKCNTCGARIRRERERLKLSQEQFAAKLQLEGLNLTQKAISRIETRDRVIADYELPTIARILGVSVVELLGIE